MCGIAGIVHYDPTRGVDGSVLRQMTRVLSHRGPDGEGYFEDLGVGLGHRRLAIIDLATGCQPMFSPDGQLALVFNGEIYNYLELKEELKTLGHKFLTMSDTEVILAAYQQWGVECLDRFNGMWAFALWDSRRKSLFVARDRIGEKPLHYAELGRTFIFGSEIKSILAYESDFKPATELLHVYLTLGYVPAPYTFYRGILRLMPGHYLLVRDGRVQDHKYWDLPDIAESDLRTDAPHILEEFEELFSEAVRLRMRSDVPFGAFLSGGLDSGSVVAAMSVQSPLPVETFTIGFAARLFDERDLAREVAETFRTHHHERVATPDLFDDSLRRVLNHFDEPFGDASAIPVGVVSKLARKHVTMVLTGDGGDEVLSGYTNYVTEKLTSRFRVLPRWVRRSLHACTFSAMNLARGDLRYRMNRAERFLRLADCSYNDRALAKMSFVGRESIRNLIPQSLPQVAVEEYFSSALARCPFKDGFYRQMYFNLKVSLPEDMLAKVDRMSMAHSLEARVPFLDHRLVELTYQVHKDVKMPRLRRKELVRGTIGRRLPLRLLNAPKQPFLVPLREWFKQDDFNERLRELQRGDAFLNARGIAELVRANREGQNDYGDFIWRLFVLKRWMESRSAR